MRLNHAQQLPSANLSLPVESTPLRASVPSEDCPRSADLPKKISGPLGFPDTVDHWRTGEGRPLLVGFSSVDVSFLDPAFFADDNPRSVTFPRWSEQWFVFGTLNMRLTDGYVEPVKPDTYNFDWKEPDASASPEQKAELWRRNVLTWFGGKYHGKGCEYEIRFEGRQQLRASHAGQDKTGVSRRPRAL